MFCHLATAMNNSKTTPAKSKSSGSRFLPQSWHDALQFDREPIKRWVIEQVLPKIKPTDRVLDAGSGNIDEQRLRNELLATGAKLDTLDFLPGAGIDIVADITNTGLAPNSYDVILCMQVLEHVQDPGAVCRELARLVKPGGWIALTAPQSAWLHNLPWHYFHFTREGFALLCKAADLEMQLISPQGGHFMQLGNILHYSCRVVEAHARGKWWERIGKPFFPVLRIVLGLGTKTLCLWLDRLMPDDSNTQGWNVLCRKPETASRSDQV